MEPQERASRPPGKRERGGHTILVVDDDAAARQLLCRALVQHGYEVEMCEDAVVAFEALERLCAEGGSPLLVLDYSMPKFNGAELCEIIRAHKNPDVAQTPIILLTALDDREHELQCLNAGADDFVSKPVNLAVLRARIGTSLRVATLRRELQEKNRELEAWHRVHVRDLEAARLVQRATLPGRMAQVSGWEVAARFEPLIQVGGDIYDWNILPDGRWLFWIADATGHGASAALLTTFTKLLFRYAAVVSDPEQVLERVHHDFLAIFNGRAWLTAACVVIAPGAGHVEMAGAGHPPVAVLRQGRVVQLLESSVPPLGLPAWKRHPVRREVSLEHGDILMLFTDGVYSATAPGEPRLTVPRFLERWEGEQPALALEAVSLAFLHGLGEKPDAAFDDDAAVVALRYR